MDQSTALRSYVKLEIDDLKPDTLTDFPIYLQVAGHHVLYAPPPYKWLADEISRLKLDGFKELFFPPQSTPMVESYFSITKIRPINESLAPHQRIGDITEVVKELTKSLYDCPLSASSVHKAQQIAKSLIRCVEEDITCIQALGKLAHHDEYTYLHSARVAAYALALAIKMSETDEIRLEAMTTGCLLHDIGKSQVGLAVLNKPGPLTPEEWVEMRRHPEFGAQMLDQKSPLGHIPRSIILHHHERLDGKGYPHGLSQNEILEEVKIASFADLFDAMTTTRPYQKGRSRYEALDFIRFNLLNQVHKEAFKAMVEILNQSPKSKTAA